MRAVGAVLAAATLLLAAAGHVGAQAGEDDDPPPEEGEREGDGEERVGGFINGPDIGAMVDDGDVTESGGGEAGSIDLVSSEPQPICEYFDAIFQRNDYFEIGVFEYRYIDLHLFRYRPDTGQAWIRMRYACTYAGGSTTTEYVWRTTVDPDPRLLAESAYEDIQEEYVRPPVPALSPVTSGVVNLGMWLAVAEPELDPISVTASAGNVSATTTAALSHTTFDMGDGSPLISCDRVGDPIPPESIDTVEQSPICGHTYSSTNGGAPFEITIASYWDVSWSSNIGAGGDLGTMDRTATVSYEVVEIQTVGGPGGDS